MSKIVAFRFHAPRFKPAAGEPMTNEQLDAIIEAEEKSGIWNDDFIQLGAFGKELAEWLQRGLEERGYSIGENWADDWARLVSVEAGNGKTATVACSNEETEVDHIINVLPQKGLLGRLLGDSDYDAFFERLIADLEEILRSDREISRIRIEKD